MMATTSSNPIIPTIRCRSPSPWPRLTWPRSPSPRHRSPLRMRLSNVYTVTNEGDAPAIGPWTDTLYLSTNSVWDDQAYTLGSLESIRPPPGPGRLYRNQLGPTARVARGRVYLILQIDSSGVVADADQTNNLLVLPIALQAPRGAARPRSDFPGRPRLAPTPGHPSVVYTVTNTGEPTAWQLVRRLVSTNSVLDNSATLLNTLIYTGPLPGWTTYRGTNMVALPDSPAGPYYLIIQVDACSAPPMRQPSPTMTSPCRLLARPSNQSLPLFDPVRLPIGRHRRPSAPNTRSGPQRTSQPGKAFLSSPAPTSQPGSPIPTPPTCTSASTTWLPQAVAR